MEIKKDIFIQIQSIVSNAQSKAIRAVDNERVLMYWQIGKIIFEEEQQGKDRADYGRYLIKTISETFQPQFGSGFSVRQLEMNRQFYRTFPIASALRSQFNWTHYRTIIRIENQDKRDFYMAEAEKNNWTATDCEMDVDMNLFLLTAASLRLIYEAFKSSKYMTFPHVLFRDVVINQERIVKALSK
ncbi:hypothetical protein J2X69_000402 [Algoriphagus sp. 4150]|uniref:DUF1016 N-terminal domain-containing protein n=1 Tax=Algoriphagus sp. 4150 TaxID=2817756 RepID=UPI0028567EBD|nr:DUF1016 N-terminal domain-containing protein [Algoriphagus sp. 4150]MDR7128074.1 hypothetical protein [Algoriphagus sp. 4150]